MVDEGEWTTYRDEGNLSAHKLDFVECKWKEWKVTWCSSVTETITKARATCCARCEE